MRSSIGIRLNKFLSNAGVCARRKADLLIQAGHITVNGKCVTTLGYRVDCRDVVRYRNQVVQVENLVYILLNKPKDCITTTEDPQQRRTVYHFLKARNCIGGSIVPSTLPRVYPVGRLDHCV